MKNALMLRVMWMCGFLVALACRVTLAAAPVKRTSPTPHNAVKPSKPTTNTPRTSSAKPTNPFAHLKPLNSGPGIIVCEPISTTGNAAFGAFGVGCGRWLHVTVGGQGELGKTPLFPYIAYAEHEKQWPNLRLSPENALEIANMLGATHVATGHIEGTPAKCELAYQLWEATGGGEIGTPIVAAGSQADIVAALPRIARELAVRLGVANPFIPPAVNVTPTELTGIGYIPLGSPFVLQPDWKQQLLAKAGECPLAGLIIIESKEVTPEVVGRVLAPSVDNVVILGEIGVAKPTLLQPYDTQINQLVQKFPYNYQLATIDGLRKRSQENRKAEIAAMELAVLCSPGNSWAWIYLGDALSNQAEDIRKSRIAGQITDAEWASLNKLYPLWQAAETRATQLDKLNSWAWADLATAATFNSNSRIADAALWKALELNPYNASTYSWGLQMYQPKWDDDPAKLLKVAEAAAKQRFLTPTLAYEVVDVLQNFTEVTDHTQQIIMLALGQLLGSNLTDPRSSGPGVLICEPVAAQSTGVKADANTTKFGIGCGRWLHFTVGGLPEFGKTPLWHDVDEARRFLKFPDLRLSAAQATRLATALGATHIATGRIEGTAQHCKLIYRLYHLEKGGAGVPREVDAESDQPGVIAHAMPLGDPCILEGSAAEVTSHLPALAQQMAARLGGNTPHQPTSVGAEAPDLMAVGQWPWTIRKPPNEEQSNQLLALAEHLPVAGMIALSYAGHNQLPADIEALDIQPPQPPELLHTLTQSLLKQAPDNPLAWGQIGQFAPQELLSHADQITHAVEQHPDNYLLTTVSAWLQSQKRNTKEQLKADWLAVRCNTYNPFAWLELGSTIANLADETRQGRAINQMAPSELQYVERLYPLWYRTVRQATVLDPMSSIGWVKASQAASFNSSGSTADDAFWKALAIDPQNLEVYYWGLQMYQPKWQDDQNKLWKVATMAAADEVRFILLSPDIIEALQASGLNDAKATELLQTANVKLNTLASLNPPNASIHKKLGFFFWNQKQNEHAQTEFERWVQLSPNDAEAQYWLGGFLYSIGRYDETAIHYREAIRLNPDSEALLYLGDLLVWRSQAAEAEPLLRHYIQLHPSNARAHLDLGKALLALNKTGEAQAEWAVAVKQDQVTDKTGQKTLGQFGKQAQEALSKNPAPLTPKIFQPVQPGQTVLQQP